ncbi:hypothetical protein [Streptomyces sp. NBC_01262]|uniref:hypothetical protein n=1 Tax=Streptomyces sp. NBC_01262 TaxID=2903803 RepID=UPI002E3186FC|nr:hypothetical protein [Streptomyces sp. NBC_01262]
MSALTVGEQGPTITALAQLLADFPHLPAAHIEIGRILTRDGYALGVGIMLHHATGGTLADFEAWRQSLAIAPEAVGMRPAAADQVIEAHGRYAGVAVHVRCFTRLAVPLAVAA